MFFTSDLPNRSWSAERTNDPRIQQISLEDAGSDPRERLRGKRSEISWRILWDIVKHGSVSKTLAESQEFRDFFESPFPDWFNRALEQDTAGDMSSSVDIIYDKTDHLLSEKEFGSVDRILRNAPINTASLTFLMGLLSITLPASAYLPSRESFFNRVWEECVARGRDAEKLLSGLRRWG